MERPPLWFMTHEPQVLWNFSHALLRDDELGIQNTKEFMSAEFALADANGILNSDNILLPPEFLTMRLAMPDDVTPDYFYHDGYTIVSRRMKEAMAQEEEVVQFVPVALVRGGPQAQAQDYHIMRILARQPAMDLERSECDIEELTNRKNGQKFKRPRFVTRFVLLDDLCPRSEIFLVDELPSRVLVTDSVAHSVLQAGCTGVEFRDPANKQSGMRIDRYRTLEGVAERKVGFLDDVAIE
jgi:hypothetical protein